MFRKSIIPIVSSVSLGIGVLAGTKLERWTQSVNKERKILPWFPSVLAVKLDDVGTPVQESGGKPSSVIPVNRSQEIMRFGFPGFDQVRTFDNYVMSYDRRNKNAHWVFEHLTPQNLAYDESVNRRNSEFREDSSIHQYFRSTNYDYRRTPYDKGHLAAAQNHRISQNALDQTFFLSNTSPQVGEGFNRGVWNDLEKYVRAVARNNRNVYVCTGPLYLPRLEADGKVYVKYEVIGQNHVAVPTHFFKVIVIENMIGQFELQSYVMPNQMLPANTPLKQFFWPLDAIERSAGFLLFDKIPRNMFHKINNVKR
ncbi:endonuclease G, mitochondrial-like [Haliotis rubra]|uniref:endonuclease G, mitochondrial-like n=1 Tax=Haliotis rubra TaxID=36100 RepID=UPI001EE55F48|nr:endonuclease G, mitochondrial-like [Haliotis rubra]